MKTVFSKCNLNSAVNNELGQLDELDGSGRNVKVHKKCPDNRTGKEKGGLFQVVLTCPNLL